MNETEIIIIGAGAAGLMLAREITKKGKDVIILEAKDRIGGRIYSVKPPGFKFPIEMGAEFIHGDLPLTSSILKEAGIPEVEMQGDTYKIEHTKVIRDENMVEGQKKLLHAIDSLKEDIPFAEFIRLYFNDAQYAKTRDSAIRLVEGYQAADINRASTKALKEELQGGGLDATCRPGTGYIGLIDFLHKEVKKSRGTIYLNSSVKNIFWKEGRVEVSCENGETFSSRKVIVTVSLGVLQCSENKKAFIHFSPELPAKRNAINKLGFGTIIKAFLLFKQRFWEGESNGGYTGIKLPGLGFLLNNEPPVRAWWTQLPDETPLITAWIAGPAAINMQHLPDDQIIDKIINHLAGLLNTSRSFLKEQLVSGTVNNWGEDPYSCGAYSYKTVDSDQAVDFICEPVENTLYFAGEAFYKGTSIGTVEAALSSALQTAKLIF